MVGAVSSRADPAAFFVISFAPDLLRGTDDPLPLSFSADSCVAEGAVAAAPVIPFVKGK
jgi:hypothetical protein